MAQALNTAIDPAELGAISAGQICHQPASISVEPSIAAQAKTKGCPAHVLAAIYGKKPADKALEYDHSLKRYPPACKKVHICSLT